MRVPRWQNHNRTHTRAYYCRHVVCIHIHQRRRSGRSRIVWESPKNSTFFHGSKWESPSLKRVDRKTVQSWDANIWSLISSASGKACIESVYRKCVSIVCIYIHEWRRSPRNRYDCQSVLVPITDLPWSMLFSDAENHIRNPNGCSYVIPELLRERIHISIQYILGILCISVCVSLCVYLCVCISASWCTTALLRYAKTLIDDCFYYF